MGEFARPDAGRLHPLSVSALLACVKDALAEAFPKSVTVIGEISNLKVHSSGHVYFRLKDARAAIDAVMFRPDAARLKFTPQDGLEVIAEGRVDVYEVRGQLQFYVEQLIPKGAGALELAFRQLCEKLEREGLFDPAAKKRPVKFPRAVGVVTSPTGAAIRDICRALLRRWPAAKVYVAPALVQGEGAAATIAEAVALLDAGAERYEIDTIIVARGGGSLEDLWPFNEEIVARAIFAARTPIISGIGHEADVTIADLVADVRAATPTAAAELAVPDAGEVSRHLAALLDRLSSAATKDLRAARAALEAICRSAVVRDPASMLRTQVQRLDELSHRLSAALRERMEIGRRRLRPLSDRLASVHPAMLAERAKAAIERVSNRMRWALGAKSKLANDALLGVQGRLSASHPHHRLKLARQQLEAAARHIEAMSHRNVLKRGFSVTRLDGRIIRSAAQPHPGQTIETEFHDGRITSHVDDKKPAAPDRQAEAGRRGPDARRPQRKIGRQSEDTGPTLFDP